MRAIFFIIGGDDSVRIHRTTSHDHRGLIRRARRIASHGQSVTTPRGAAGASLQVRTRDQLPQNWATTQNNLGNALQMYFQVNEFRAGLEQFGRLMKEKSFADDPRLVSLVQVLRVMCQKALAEEAQATEALGALIVHLEQQAAPFRIDWSFSWLRGIVEQSKVEAIVANRKFLLAFLTPFRGRVGMRSSPP